MPLSIDSTEEMMERLFIVLDIDPTKWHFTLRGRTSLQMS